MINQRDSEGSAAENKSVLIVDRLPKPQLFFQVQSQGTTLIPNLGVASLLLANEHEGCPVDAANAAHNGLVVKPSTIAMQLHKLVRDVKNDV